MNNDLILGLVIIVVGLVLLYVYRDKIKPKFQERIEKNAVKIPNLSWEDKKGTYTEDIIVKRSLLPLVGDWSRIYPPVDEYGNWNWVNAIFGGKKNLIKLAIMLGLVAFVLFSFYNIFVEHQALKELCEPLLETSKVLQYG